LLSAQPKPVAAAKPLAFTHVTVIDATGRPPLADRTVVITGDRITALGKTGEVVPPTDAQVIDAAGKFLIPGLWAMHVHIAGRDYMSLFLANGVTGARDMHAYFPVLTFGMRKAVEEGQLLGPRIVAAGALVDGPKPFRPGSREAKNAAEGQAAVQA